MKYGFGIDLGGTTVKIAYFDETGNMLDKWEIPTVTAGNEKAKAKATREAIKQQPKVKSLHYIDDEDYDSLPELQGSSADESKKGLGGIEGGDLKK